jgi:hypothetical protein
MSDTATRKKLTCERHKRKLEAYCDICDDREGKEQAMCAICMCEHHNKVHGGKMRHITSTIQEILGQVSTLMLKGDDHQAILHTYNKEAERLLTSKESLRQKVEEKLNSLRKFYKNQKAEVAYNNASVLLCHESIMKATQKSEYKIKENMKDPEKVKRRVADMVDKEDYWVALEEAKRALNEDARFDDTQIKEEFEKGRVILANYEQQLLALDVMPLDCSEYSKLLNEKAGLAKENEKAKGF